MESYALVKFIDGNGLVNEFSIYLFMNWIYWNESYHEPADKDMKVNMILAMKRTAL